MPQDYLRCLDDACVRRHRLYIPYLYNLDYIFLTYIIYDIGYCTEVPVLDSFHDTSQDHTHSLSYALSIYRLKSRWHTSCISVTTHLQFGRLTQDTL